MPRSKKPRQSYLGQLQFDPGLLRGIVASYLGNFRLVILLMIASIGFGLYGFLQLPRRLNPEINIAIVSVVTALPGASPASVEDLITIPLERELLNVEGLDTLTSSSTESTSVISLQFLSSVTRETAQSRVQQLVDSVSDLPDDAQTPRVAALDFEDVPVWQVALTAENEDLASLARAAERLEKELELVSGIDRVVVAGVPEEQVQVLISPTTLATVGLQPTQLAQAIQAAITALPAGVVSTGTSTLSVSLQPEVETIDELRELVIAVDGRQYRLQDLAIVQWAPTKSQRRSYVVHPGAPRESAVLVFVYKTSGADISTAQKAAAQRTEEVLAAFPTIELQEVENVAEEIDTQFADLGSNFATTIALVFLTLFIFLGIRQALVVSFTIPLTFLVAFGIMQVTGQTLNFLTLFSLLLALGLLVDDAIVAVSSITAYYRTGKFSPLEAGLLVWRDFIVPIFTTTITTVWAFVPLLLSTGIIGEFIKPIPIIVSSALLTSTVVAVLVALPTMILFLGFSVPERVKRFGLGVLIIASLIVAFSLLGSLPYGWVSILVILLILFEGWRIRKELSRSLQAIVAPMKKSSHWLAVSKTVDSGVVNLQAFEERFAVLIEKIIATRRLRWQVVLSVAAFSLFAYALLPLGFVQNEFFPKTDADILYVGIEMPTGTALSETEARSLLVLDAIADIPELRLAVLELGAVPPTAAGGGSDATAAISVRLLPASERSRTSIQLATSLRESLPKVLPAGTVSVAELSGGPPVGSDIALKISGTELSELDSIATQIESHLRSTEGVINIDRSVKAGPSQLVFQPDMTVLAENRLSPIEVSFWLRTALSGYTLGEVDFGNKSEKTEIQLYLSDRLYTPEEIHTVQVISGESVYSLDALGKLVLEPSPSQISREQGRRTLTVSASVAEGFSVSAANESLLSFTEQLELPEGYRFETGGVNEENQRSVQAILLAMVLSFILILATMVIQLGSFRQAAVVMLVIPLAVSGVFVLFALTGTPLSFPALIGVLALFGIVVNNSIVLVDKINQNRVVGLPLVSAISDATASRMEPILFSSMTTIIGLIPITLSDPLWRGLGGAIIAGLSVSGAIMLLFIPIVYWWLFKDESLRDESLRAVK